MSELSESDTSGEPQPTQIPAPNKGEEQTLTTEEAGRAAPETLLGRARREIDNFFARLRGK